MVHSPQSRTTTTLGSAHNLQLAKLLQQQYINGVLHNGESLILPFKKMDLPPEAVTWKPNHVNICDNAQQMNILKHHYETESSNEQLLQDYADDSVIYELIDGKPLTHRGSDGILASMTDVLKVAPSHSVELQHIKIHHNHAQVIWEAHTPDKDLFGTDSYTFNKSNKIQSQSTVILSQNVH